MNLLDLTVPTDHPLYIAISGNPVRDGGNNGSAMKGVRQRRAVLWDICVQSFGFVALLLRSARPRSVEVYHAGRGPQPPHNIMNVELNKK